MNDVFCLRYLWTNIPMNPSISHKAIKSLYLNIRSAFSTGYRTYIKRNQYWGSGSGPWSVPVSFSTKCKDRLSLFPEKFQYAVQIMKILTTMTLMRKIKQSKLALLWLKVKKFRFSNLFITWCRIRIRIDIKIESRIRIGIKTTPIHDTGLNRNLGNDDIIKKIPCLRINYRYPFQLQYVQLE